MFIIFLEFTEKRDKAKEYMEGHKAWLESGFNQGWFVLAGSLKSSAGGSIIAHNASLDNLERFVSADPFVKAGIVAPKIVELEAFKVDERLKFLIA